MPDPPKCPTCKRRPSERYPEPGYGPRHPLPGDGWPNPGCQDPTHDAADRWDVVTDEQIRWSLRQIENNTREEAGALTRGQAAFKLEVIRRVAERAMWILGEECELRT